MTLRIVDVCAFYSPQGGGVKTYVERKLAAARRGEQHVTLVIPGARSGLVRESEAGAIVSVASPLLPVDRRYRYFADEQALHNLLDHLKPDVVEASSPWSSPAMVARWRGRAIRSLVMHADPLSAYAYRWFGRLAERDTIDRGFDWFWRHLRRLDSQFDLVVCAGASLAGRLRSGGLTKVMTLPMGVEPGIFSPRHRDEALRSRLLARCGLDDGATLLVGAGRLAAEKRWPMVIEAVTAAGYQHSLGLLLLGNGRDRSRVVRAAANNPHVQLGAPITDRAQFAAILASCDALVHGCEAETFCLVAAEAKASGLPLIVPDEGGTRDQFTPGQGALYTPRDAADLANAISSFVQSSPQAHRVLAAAEAGKVLSMDAHFETLFATYAARVRGTAMAA